MPFFVFIVIREAIVVYVRFTRALRDCEAIVASEASGILESAG